MKINVFGLGYVGCISAACLADQGNHVTGIDIDEKKIRMINDGKSPIIEPGLAELTKKVVTSGMLRAVINDVSDLEEADVSMVCVGTPSNENGSLNLEYIKRVCKQIGSYLKIVRSYHVVNIRSTVLPETVEKKIISILEEYSGKDAGQDFGVCMNPEFLREGSSLEDYHNPPFTLIGELDEKSGATVARIYESIDAPIIRTRIKVAEMIKYACNAFHALKVSFANEIGNICDNLDIDSHEVMDIFCRDDKLNISACYLKPGFAFGGSCLPKDLRAILYKAKGLDLELPVLSSILPSNDLQVKKGFRLVEKIGKKKVGVLGISFKPGTDDLRESPMVELIEKLLGKGYQISIYDREVSLSRLIGANKRYIETVIPHVASLMKESAQEVVRDSDVIIVGNKIKEFEEVVFNTDQNKTILDMVRIISDPREKHERYKGICW
jgi:GDP-mannose 6-dehydrogenase